MKKKYYLDTSVFGGYFDMEFKVDTKRLFKSILNESIIILYSEMTESEIQTAPDYVRDFVLGLPKNCIEYIEITKESLKLADHYIYENVVGKTSRDDCIHIALATLYRADVLINWNFKHIVNLRRINGYNSVNLKLGYPILEIRAPNEMIDYENNG